MPHITFKSVVTVRKQEALFIIKTTILSVCPEYTVNQTNTTKSQ